jgi:hypothetical protein
MVYWQHRRAVSIFGTEAAPKSVLLLLAAGFVFFGGEKKACGRDRDRDRGTGGLGAEGEKEKERVGER